MDTKEIVQLIREASFFQEFSAEELKAILDMVSVKTYQPGDTIITKGDSASAFYILLKGQVEVIFFRKNQENLILHIEEGHCFGEMALLSKTTRTACCIALDEVSVLEFRAATFDLQNPAIIAKIYKQIAVVLSHRLHTTTKFLQQTSFNPAQSDISSLEETACIPPANTNLPPSTNKPEVTAETPKEISAPKITSGLSNSPFLQRKTPKETPQKTEETPVIARGQSEEIDPSIRSQDEYDILTRKVQLRSQFLAAKISPVIVEMITNKFFGYWTGSKLAKVNPHELWPADAFNPGSPVLKRALHLVVVYDQGEKAFEDAYLGLAHTHRVIGLPEIGCVGTFLDSKESIERYLAGKCLKKAISQDFDIPIDREHKGKEVIEFLAHTKEDLRPQSLFLVFDSEKGTNTKLIRDAFPQVQILTVVLGYGYNPEDLGTIFTQPETELLVNGHLVEKSAYKGSGFYRGQTAFLPDFSAHYTGMGAIEKTATIFGTIGVIAQIGPDYSGIVWGSKGGAEGAVKASRAMFGIKGAQSAADIASAVSWADN